MTNASALDADFEKHERHVVVLEGEGIRAERARKRLSCLPDMQIDELP
jgi:hypothetical protein